jgi:hypothetical protein
VTGQRVHERYPIRLPVTVLHDGNAYATETRNVSMGGFFVDLVSPIPFGAPVRIVFRLPAMKVDSEVDATVRWKQPDGLGLQFGSLRALDTWGLNQLLKSYTPAP